MMQVNVLSRRLSKIVKEKHKWTTNYCIQASGVDYFKLFLNTEINLIISLIC
jgi:hypothetical protein